MRTAYSSDSAHCAQHDINAHSIQLKTVHTVHSTILMRTAYSSDSAHCAQHDIKAAACCHTIA